MEDGSQSVPYRRIGTILVERGLITDSQLALALAEQEASGRLLGEIVVDSYGVSRVDLADVLAEQWEEAQRLTAAGRDEPPAGSGEGSGPATSAAGTAAEDELRTLLQEAEAARAELARRTDELARRLAALEALVIGVSGALDELRSSSRDDAVSAQSVDGPRSPRGRSGRRSTVSR